ncbi:hypothetical protein PENTCL1PPCAC_12021, partial [Pristionchus entomophagus]
SARHSEWSNMDRKKKDKSLDEMTSEQIKERIHLSKISQVKENDEVEKLEILCREVEDMLPVWKINTENLCRDTGELLKSLESTSGALESSFRKMQMEIEDEIRSIKDKIRDLVQRAEEVHKLQSEVHMQLVQAKIAKIASVFSWIYNFISSKIENAFS